MRPNILSTIILYLLFTTSELSAEPPEPGLSLIFEEEFDTLDLAGRDLGTHRWHQLNSHGKHVSRNLLQTDDGILTMESPPDAKWGVNTSIATAPDWPNSGSAAEPLFGLGYYEARIRFDPKPNSWPAFWLFPPVGLEHATGRIPKSVENAWCEIDILEGLTPSTYGASVHDWKTGVTPHNIYNKHNNIVKIPNTADFRNWNTYGVYWTENLIEFYFNGQRVLSVSTPKTCKNERMMLIVGSQSYGGPATHKVQVDWIRVYR